jgi:hypothetical protein
METVDVDVVDSGAGIVTVVTSPARGPRAIVTVVTSPARGPRGTEAVGKVTPSR